MADKKLLGYRVKSGPLYVVATVGVTRYIDAYADPGERLLTHDQAMALKVEWDKKWSPMSVKFPLARLIGVYAKRKASLSEQLLGLYVLANQNGLYDAADWMRGASEALIDLTTNSSHIRGV